jgi:hypothetical protein
LYAVLRYVLDSGNGVTILGAQFTVQAERFPTIARDTANALKATVTIARMASRPPEIATCEVVNRRPAASEAGGAIG